MDVLRSRGLRGWTLLLAFGLALSMQSLSAASQRGVDWPMYNGDYSGTRFSPLTQIDVANARALRRICSFVMPETGVFETGPVVVNGVMYATTLHKTVAMDAATCAVKWTSTYVPVGPREGYSNRGVAVDGRLVVRGMTDGHIVALDAVTGQALWNVDTARDAFVSAAPIIWKDTVYVGLAGSDWGIQGEVVALDARTGSMRWHFNTIPAAGEPGSETWQLAAGAQAGGGGQWSTLTLDTTTGDLLVPTGNPYPDFQEPARKGSNLYTDSLVDLDAASGQLRWYYQLTPGDFHDWDFSAAPALFTSPSGEQLIALGHKNGYLYVMDRATHEIVRRTAVTTILNHDVRPVTQVVRTCPGAAGGVEWNGPAVAPKGKAIYVGSVDWCWFFSAWSRDLAWGAHGDSTRSGWIRALDLSGRALWTRHMPAPVVSGVLATAGNLVFAGDMNGNFVGLNASTGGVLFAKRLGSPISGGVVTYEERGQQFVAVAVGTLLDSWNWHPGSDNEIVVYGL